MTEAISADKVLRLIVVRHTQTENNANRILTGQHDPIVNPRGLTQSLELASALFPKRISAVYASDLRRTRFVAEVIAIRHPGVPFFCDARLREVNIGALTGLNRDEARARFPEDRFRTSNANFDYSSVGGETRRELALRQLGFFRGLYLRHAGEPGAVAVVGHGTSLRVILPYLGYGGNLPEQGGFTELDVARIPDDNEVI